MEAGSIVLIFLIASLVGAVVGFVVFRKRDQIFLKKIEEERARILKEAVDRAKGIENEAHLAAKERLIQVRSELEKEMNQEKRNLAEVERKLLQKESNLDKKVNILDAKESELSKKEKEFHLSEEDLSRKKQTYEKLVHSVNEKLEKVAAMTATEAKEALKSQIEDSARKEAAASVKRIQEEAREQSEEKAKKIISFSIQRYAGEYVTESTVTTVSLPSDEMKGRIIGREGRNIRCFESVTGVDVIIDDTPETVILSCFDPVRRAVAKLTLERLLEDGRIHPSRIEEIHEKTQQEVDVSIKEAGEQATFDVGVHGIHPEVLKVLGSLKFRVNNGQNVYRHSIEVSFLSGMIAAELGEDELIAKRAGLLHDIGLGLEHTVSGSHSEAGASFLKKHGEREDVLHAVSCHSAESRPQTVLAHIVESANSLSLSRPGAKREALQTYIKRLEDLEKIASSFEGVTRAYAISAGREVKVLVNHQTVSDEEAVLLSRDISKKIESDLTYPGQIKVNVLRETRVVEIAR
ncbi:MAG: ribonuclease Y [Deltaproteobacteria bacterium]|nr:ribonuclease Y [Deltaproteobacteria bacterium]